MACLLDIIARPSAVILQLSVVLGVIFVLLKVAQFYKERKKLIKALEAFPGPPKHWLYGHNHLLNTTKILNQIVSWGEEYPYAFPRWLGPVLPSLVIHHPEYAKSIFGQTDSKSDVPYKFLVPWIGQGLLNLDGTKWFQHRKLLTPAFHYDVLKSYVALMSESVKVMLDANGVGLSDEDLRAEVDTFMFAGHDTTASGISWLFYCLSLHPEYQQRCREEIQGILGDRDTVEWEDLGKMTYTTMCIKESLRLFPPVPSVSRYLSKPVTFPDGRSLPAGCQVGVNIFAIHRNRDVWEDPEIYDPLRFSPENSAQRHSHAFLPFSAGSRNCIGQQFAMNEIKVALALTLLRFELCPNPSMPPTLIQQLILKSRNGFHLHLKKIH